MQQDNQNNNQTPSDMNQVVSPVQGSDMSAPTTPVADVNVSSVPTETPQVPVAEDVKIEIPEPTSQINQPMPGPDPVMVAQVADNLAAQTNIPTPEPVAAPAEAQPVSPSEPQPTVEATPLTPVSEVTPPAQDNPAQDSGNSA